MKTLAEVRGMCHIEDGHWFWKGAKSGGRPNITAPDWTSKGGKQVSQRGARAVWHIKTRKPVPKGHRVFLTCGEPTCVNPAHVQCRNHKEWGQEIAKSGAWLGNPKRVVAARRNSLLRSRVTAAKIATIVSSPDRTGPDLARELGITNKTVSRIRLGKFISLPVGNPFAGLGA